MIRYDRSLENFRKYCWRRFWRIQRWNEWENTFSENEKIATVREENFRKMEGFLFSTP